MPTYKIWRFLTNQLSSVLYHIWQRLTIQNKKENRCSGSFVCFVCSIFCLVFLQIFIWISMKSPISTFLNIYTQLENGFWRARVNILRAQSLWTRLYLSYAMMRVETRKLCAVCTTNSCNSSAMPILVWFCEKLQEFLKC